MEFCVLKAKKRYGEVQTRHFSISLTSVSLLFVLMQFIVASMVVMCSVEHIIQPNLTDDIALKEEEKRRTETIGINAVPQVVIPGEVRITRVPVLRIVEDWVGFQHLCASGTHSDASIGLQIGAGGVDPIDTVGIRIRPSRLLAHMVAQRRKTVPALPRPIGSRPVDGLPPFQHLCLSCTIIGILEKGNFTARTGGDWIPIAPQGNFQIN